MANEEEAAEERGREPGSAARKLTLGAVAAVILVMLGVVAFITYKGHKKRVDETAIVAAVGESTAVLREVLGGKTEGAIARLDPLLARIKAAERTPLADAAEDYVLGSREVARRRAEANRLQPQTVAARQALLNHLAAGGRRSDGWFKQAGDLKKRVEGAYFEVGVQLKALDGLLDGMQESRKRLGALVPGGEKQLIDAQSISTAREQALQELKRNAEELERARQIPIG